eukprot:6146457-Pleurochrysis_carterae.AAC.1
MLPQERIAHRPAVLPRQERGRRRVAASQQAQHVVEAAKWELKGGKLPSSFRRELVAHESDAAELVCRAVGHGGE